MNKIINKILRSILYFIIGLIGFTVLYVLFSILFSIIPVNKNFKNTDSGTEIYILSNGVHTDIVMPIKNDLIDWSRKVKVSHTIANDTNSKYVSFGWGDKGFYLETPTWADLKFKTAFRAAFFLSSSAMHVSFYRNIKTDALCKKIKINKIQYLKLTTYIENYFQKDSLGNFINIKGHSYSDNDAFYDAKRVYNLFFTCNTWTNQALKVSGLKCALWTPSDKGILWHYY